ncbi:MAG TPA: BadF/BadG/BcrA/BcrD ATPase family protein, partial [Gaiellaceae bacterium]|nr:BadF/BadG/BcrA/BcrD ATPase family protein [Gaiellaceae bacterium]
MKHAIAVDGGNSKTDVALVREDGEVVATARGGGSSPQHLGVEGSLAVIGALLDQVRDGLPVDAAELLLAGVDFPAEEQAVRAGIEERGWARNVSVDNDTFAVLRAGTDAGWGVAVVCGAGINCVGVAPDGRQARFRALGWTTGDWGGGAEVGREAVWAAARSEDGRGPKTVLERLVPAHFG